MMFRNEHPRERWEQKAASIGGRPFGPESQTDGTRVLPPPLWPETETLERTRYQAAFNIEQRRCQLFAD